MGSQTHYRRSIRLPGYDYTQPGAYFVTICTWQKTILFGDIFAGEIKHTSFGKIAQRELERLPQRFSHIQLDCFTVMPNHIHMIIVISSNNLSQGNLTEQFGRPVSGSILTIVRSYKSAVTSQTKIRRDAPKFPLWQSNYYKHVIQNEAEWGQIRIYIENNPIEWESDSEYSG
jgi:REP element-mobilizing transposase RayT